MADSKTPTVTADTDAYDPAETGRTLGKIRAEITQLNQDAKRRSPYFAKSQVEAVAKRDAALRVLREFADRLDAMKKE